MVGDKINLLHSQLDGAVGHEKGLAVALATVDWLTGDNAHALAQISGLVSDGTVSTSAAKEVFAGMVADKAEPEDVVERRGLGQISDTSELEAAVARVLSENPAQVEQYRGGKQQVLGFLVGQVMKATGGRANPQLVNELLRAALDG